MGRAERTAGSSGVLGACVLVGLLTLPACGLLEPQAVHLRAVHPHVVGTVSDARGQPIYGADVWIEYMGGCGLFVHCVITAGTSNYAGEYSLDYDCADSVRLGASKAQYRTNWTGQLPCTSGALTENIALVGDSTAH